jgi:hypothetical protein
MSGSSLDFTWDDWVDGLPLANADNDTRTYLYAWNNAAMVNQVKYHAKNASGRNGRVDFIRKKQNGLTIVINYHGTDEVKITSDNEENSSGVKTNPPNLKVISIAGGNAHMSDYEALGRFLLKHPTKGRKVRTITFSGVAMGTATGNHQCVASGQSYVCTVNGPLGDDDSRLRISVCRPSSLNPCPQPQ